MRVYLKNVYIGTISVFDNKNKNVFDKISSLINELTTKPDTIFIKIDDTYYVELDDVINSKLPKNIAMKSVQKYSTQPTKQGETYISNLKHLYKINKSNENEKIGLEDISNSNNLSL